MFEKVLLILTLNFKDAIEHNPSSMQASCLGIVSKFYLASPRHRRPYHCQSNFHFLHQIVLEMSCRLLGHLSLIRDVSVLLPIFLPKLLLLLLLSLLLIVTVSLYLFHQWVLWMEWYRLLFTFTILPSCNTAHLFLSLSNCWTSHDQGVQGKCLVHYMSWYLALVNW